MFMVELTSTLRQPQLQLRLPSRGLGLVLALCVVSYDNAAGEPGFSLSPTLVEALHVSQVSANGRSDILSL